MVAPRTRAAVFPRQPVDHDQRLLRDELLALVLATAGEDRIMFSVDYPMARAKAGADWLRTVDLPRAVKEKIAHGTAQRLHGIAPV